MPWKVRKIPVEDDGDWAILKKEGGSWEIVGRSTSKEKAKASVRARRAGSNE